MSVSPFEISGGRIHSKTDLNINLTVINHKHDADMVYDNIVLSVFFKNELILVGILPPFHQEPGEKKIRVHESIVASTGYVNNWVVVSALTSPRSVKFSVRMEFRIKYFPGTSLKKIRSSTVLCEDVKIWISAGFGGWQHGRPARGMQGLVGEGLVLIYGLLNISVSMFLF